MQIQRQQAAFSSSQSEPIRRSSRPFDKRQLLFARRVGGVRFLYKDRSDSLHVAALSRPALFCSGPKFTSYQAFIHLMRHADSGILRASWSICCTERGE